LPIIAGASGDDQPIQSMLGQDVGCGGSPFPRLPRDLPRGQ
jgi:hypothetical protein